MAFSDFHSLEQVIRKYPLRIRQERFIPDVELQIPDWFVENLNFSLDQQAVDESEAFFSESFIFPFLHQVWKRHPKLKLWSHRPFAYDNELYGEPDYLVTYLTDEVIDKLINTPLLAIAEAKKADFTHGWGQCLAEMIACQKINEAEDHKSIVVYGIVSTGLIWEFGKLDRDVFFKHPLSYSISQPDKVIGILDFVFTACAKQLD